jgi:N-acetylglucosamine kinase-like BadF-type ATPase
MPSVLIAESGSTKTDWRLLQTGRSTPLVFKTTGINPHLQSGAAIAGLLHNELEWTPEQHQADAVIFYGAGAGKQEKREALTEVLKHFFGIEEVSVLGDIMGAARAMCGSKPGIVCILGTGSNSCYYDGEAICEQHASLGFIAGDEGSGNYMGKRILQYYAYRTFDQELTMAFEMKFGSDIDAIVSRLYQEPFPNRYLASFVSLLTENRGHFMVENIIEDCLNDFFHYHVLKYRKSWQLPLYFVGSVAWEFRDVIEEMCAQYELELGGVEQSPIDRLVGFHRERLMD